MKVKVAIPLAKPIRRGAFLAMLEGTKHWVTLKYECLPLFCHHCGILGHDLKHYASYYAATKNEGEIRCQYEDWLKATGGRNCSPVRRNITKDEAGGTAHREDNKTAPILEQRRRMVGLRFRDLGNKMHYARKRIPEIKGQLVIRPTWHLRLMN